MEKFIFNPERLQDYLYENNEPSKNLETCLNAVNEETGQVSKDFETREELEAFLKVFPSFK